MPLKIVCCTHIFLEEGTSMLQGLRREALELVRKENGKTWTRVFSGMHERIGEVG